MRHLSKRVVPAGRLPPGMFCALPRRGSECRRSFRSTAPCAHPCLQRLQYSKFDELNDQDEGQGGGENGGDVELLEGDGQLLTHAVRPSEALDTEHDFPDECQARTRRGG